MFFLPKTCFKLILIFFSCNNYYWEKVCMGVLGTCSLCICHLVMGSKHCILYCTVGRPWARLYPPPPPLRGILPHGNFWVLDHQSTQFRLSASELLLFVSVVLVLINTIWNSKLRWPCLLATHLLWQKRPFPYIVLLFKQFPFLFVLNVSLLLGTADAEILMSPLLKPRAGNCFPLKARSRSEYSQICLIGAIISSLS